MDVHVKRLGWIGLIRLLPRSALSAAVGRLAAVRIPTSLRRPLWRFFAWAVGADLGEIRDPLESFVCLQDFFTRSLREGIRPLSTDPAALVSPCDGTWGESGLVASDRLVQIKGRTYSLSELLDDPEEASHFEGGEFATFYLAPRDYHRFHAPFSLRIQRVTHIPGQLWPVNRIGLEGVPDLFARNERVCAYMQLDGLNEGQSTNLVMVAVGATLVGRIRLAFDDWVSRRRGARRAVRRYAGGVFRHRGEEWGRFEFGSSIVMIVAPGCASLEHRAPGSTVRLGQSIGQIDPRMSS